MIRTMLYSLLVLTVYLVVSYAYPAMKRFQDHHIIAPVAAAPYFHDGDFNRHLAVLHAGETVFLHLSSYRATDCLVSVDYRIVQERERAGTIYRTVWAEFNRTRALIHGGHYEMDIRMTIPIDIPPGDYDLDRVATYSCGGVSVDSSPQIPFHLVR